MKKTLSIILIAAIIVALSTTMVSATTSFVASLTASSTKVEQGASVVVTITLKDFTANETGINTVIGTLDYDKEIFEELTEDSIELANGWSGLAFNPLEGKFTVTNSKFMAENHEFMKITFKAKEKAAVGNTVVNLKGINASDGVDDIYPSDQKITLTVKEKTASNNTPTDTDKDNKPTNTNKDNTNKNTEKDEMPETGVVDYIVPAIIIVAVIGIFAYVRYNRIDK